MNRINHKQRFTSSKAHTKKTFAGTPWIFGYHAVKAALQNPQRHCHRLLYVSGAEQGLDLAKARQLHKALSLETTDNKSLSELLGTGMTHQGLALKADPLEQPSLDELLDQLPEKAVLVVLDHITDPHNVGAVIRSAAALGAHGVIQHVHNAPDASNTIIAKTASGGLERISLVSVTNIVHALERLKSQGFWCIGLAEEGTTPLEKIDLKGRIALVMGSEDEGLRRLVREHCDLLTFIPTMSEFSTLNVSNAAAVALYECQRQRLHERDAPK